MQHQDLRDQAVRAFTSAIDRATATGLRQHLYQCVAIMPDDPNAVSSEMAACGAQVSVHVAASLCGLYKTALRAQRTLRATRMPPAAANRATGPLSGNTGLLA